MTEPEALMEPTGRPMSTYDLANEMERMREDNAQLERERDRLVAERDAAREAAATYSDLAAEHKAERDYWKGEHLREQEARVVLEDELAALKPLGRMNIPGLRPIEDASALEAECDRLQRMERSYATQVAGLVAERDRLIRQVEVLRGDRDEVLRLERENTELREWQTGALDIFARNEVLHVETREQVKAGFAKVGAAAAAVVAERDRLIDELHDQRTRELDLRLGIGALVEKWRATGYLHLQADELEALTKTSEEDRRATTVALDFPSHEPPGTAPLPTKRFDYGSDREHDEEEK